MPRGIERRQCSTAYFMPMPCRICDSHRVISKLVGSETVAAGDGERGGYFRLLQRPGNRVAKKLVEAATSGNPRFFLGTDSAPHATDTKENACGCAGCFTAPVALSCLAEVFEEAGALDKLEGFASLHGPAFYGLPINDDTTTLEKGDPIEFPETVLTGAGPVMVFNPGRPLRWRAF